MLRAAEDIRTSAPAAPPTWVVIALACAGQFLVVLDVSVVNVALPSMRADLGLSAPGLQWVVNAYSIAFAGFMLLGGRAGDLYGRKRMFLVGLALFTLASVAGGLAQEGTQLLLARAAQGLGAAVLAPSTLTILTSAVPEGAARARAIATWTAVGAAVERRADSSADCWSTGCRGAGCSSSTCPSARSCWPARRPGWWRAGPGTGDGSTCRARSW